MSKAGWRYVQQKFIEHLGHLVPVNILKGIFVKIGRREDGSYEVIVENPTTDIDHCILYRKWILAAD